MRFGRGAGCSGNLNDFEAQASALRFLNAMQLVKVAAATLNQTPLDWDGNERRIRDILARARSEGSNDATKGTAAATPPTAPAAHVMRIQVRRLESTG